MFRWNNVVGRRRSSEEEGTAQLELVWCFRSQSKPYGGHLQVGVELSWGEPQMVEVVSWQVLAVETILHNQLRGATITTARQRLMMSGCCGGGCCCCCIARSTRNSGGGDEDCR